MVKIYFSKENYPLENFAKNLEISLKMALFLDYFILPVFSKFFVILRKFSKNYVKLPFFTNVNLRNFTENFEILRNFT